MADVVSEVTELFESILFVNIDVRGEPETIDDSGVIKDTLWVCAR